MVRKTLRAAWSCRNYTHHTVISILLQGLKVKWNVLVSSHINTYNHLWVNSMYLACKTISIVSIVCTLNAERTSTHGNPTPQKGKKEKGRGVESWNHSRKWKCKDRHCYSYDSTQPWLMQYIWSCMNQKSYPSVSNPPTIDHLLLIAKPLLSSFFFFLRKSKNSYLFYAFTS